jgi:hypothetical protein
MSADILEQLSDADVKAIFDGNADALSERGVGLVSQLSEEDFNRLLAPAEAQGVTPVDLDSANATAQADLEADMGTAERVAVGVGKTFNDIGQGVRQIFNQVTGDEEKAAEIGQELARERETFAAFDEKQIGAEDVGEFLGDAAAMLPFGAAGLTLKGGFMLGGLLEGVKGQETTNLMSRAASAAGGAGAGLVGGGVGKVFNAVGKKFSPATETIADSIGVGVNRKGLKDLVAGGVFKMLGLAPTDAGRVLLAGVRNLSSKARASDQAKRFINNRITSMTKAEEKRLAAQRAEKLDEYSREAYKQMLGIVNRMSTSNRRGVLNEETGLTLKELAANSTVKLPDGSVGIDTAALIREMPFMSKRELRAKLGDTFGKEVDALREVWQEQAGQVLSLEAIQGQMVQFNKLVTEELLPLLTKDGLTVMEKKAKKTLIDAIIGGGSVAGSQEAFEQQ